MKNRELPAGGAGKKGGKIVPALCNIFGTLILLCVIAFCLPMTIARFKGHLVYNVVSGSMEPAIPVGSVIFVEPVEPETIQEGDVIAFRSRGNIISHRVVSNYVVSGEFITKGDANQEEDMNPVKYGELVGKVFLHYPVIGHILFLYTSNVGKIYMLGFAACGAMLNILAGRLRSGGDDDSEEDDSEEDDLDEDNFDKEKSDEEKSDKEDSGKENFDEGKSEEKEDSGEDKPSGEEGGKQHSWERK